ncbi:MAG: hypothetical protein ACRDAG_04905 [Cetobacterium somerae]|mgnify:CR=1 FL=1|uniref:Peptidase M15A C-terminal domain-containing protein n=1 Tax=Cetobacterium somerae ATCC BAA-474 TaxID=1319815 RepID=U7VB63_9FUSO|nr:MULTISPECIES: hypothetical protein [Cetobacterium]ERT68726.1 hypothetical protein HMPREF0202_01376 [Cetobacterium somerae ATCC BAA-474]MBC2853508.1 hypothetical protein [Cetobacterium sp. 2G large]WVJ01671.1 hypothetical protein VSU16_02805 [Cetobacterium somerae]
MQKSKYFKGKELVSPEVYKIYGEEAIKFIAKDILIFLDLLREDLGVPILVNRPSVGITQRGLRTTIDSIVKDKVKNNKLYLSAHVLGRGVDFEVPSMDMKKVYERIINNPRRYSMITRIEDPNVTLAKGYIHVDNMETGKNGIYIFKP